MQQEKCCVSYMNSCREYRHCVTYASVYLITITYYCDSSRHSLYDKSCEIEVGENTIRKYSFATNSLFCCILVSNIQLINFAIVASATRISVPAYF